jgi:hypothetical protein
VNQRRYLAVVGLLVCLNCACQQPVVVDYTNNAPIELETICIEGDNLLYSLVSFRSREGNRVVGTIGTRWGALAPPKEKTWIVIPTLEYLGLPADSKVDVVVQSPFFVEAANSRQLAIRKGRLPPDKPEFSIGDVDPPLGLIAGLDARGYVLIYTSNEKNLYPGTRSWHPTHWHWAPSPGPDECVAEPVNPSEVSVKCAGSRYLIDGKVEVWFRKQELKKDVRYRLRIRNDDAYGGLEGVSDNDAVFR